MNRARFLSMAISFAVFVALAKGAVASDIMIMDAEVKPPLKGAAAAAASFSVMNHGVAADRLLGIVADASEVAELHQTTDENGVSRMRMVETLDIAPGATINLANEKMHVMLTGLTRVLNKGESVHLVLTFEKAGKVDVDAVVGDAGASHEHQD
jgi:periplasmic copper chaperone A